MLVEITSMTALHVGQIVYDSLKDNDKVQCIFLETGRSNHLFSEKQFGEFGEAAVITIIVSQSDQQEIFKQVYEKAELYIADQGVISLNSRIVGELGVHL